jgi:hypothetical protein
VVGPAATVTWNKGATALSSTWILFVAALCLALPQPPRIIAVLAGAVAGAGLIVVGFRAAARCRPASAKPPSVRAAFAALALLSGTLLGAALLLALKVLVPLEPALRARFAARLTEPLWRPWALAVESSILEEVMFRLFAFSVLAWLAARFLKRVSPFLVGLVGSTLLFGLAHLPAWISATHVTISLIIAVLALNSVGGLLFGWIFWRWGLPYAILSHFAGDMVIQALGPHVVN